MPLWWCSRLKAWVNRSMNPRASAGDPNRSGKVGRYFLVVNSDCESGLSFDTRCREGDLVTPRSASRVATVFEAIEVLRSACTTTGMPSRNGQDLWIGVSRGVSVTS